MSSLTLASVSFFQSSPLALGAVREWCCTALPGRGEAQGDRSGSEMNLFLFINTSVINVGPRIHRRSLLPPFFPLYLIMLCIISSTFLLIHVYVWCSQLVYRMCEQSTTCGKVYTKPFEKKKSLTWFHEPCLLGYFQTRPLSLINTHTHTHTRSRYDASVTLAHS